MELVLLAVALLLAGACTLRGKLWVVWCGVTLVWRGLRRQIGPMVNMNVRTRERPADPSVVERLPDHLRDAVSGVLRRAPCFGVHGRNVEVLHTPDAFYRSILKGLRHARRRIVIAALYLGVSDRCRALADAMDEALAENAGLTVTMLVDYGRGQRKEDGVSVMTLLTPLITKYGADRVRVCMFMVPLCGAIFRHAPATIREVAGVQHIKTFVLDDDTLITGANLNDDYFTNRQDRYVWIRSQPLLASWTARYVGALADMSFRCLPSGTTGDVVPTFPPDHSHPVYSGPSPIPFHEFSQELNERILSLLDNPLGDGSSSGSGSGRDEEALPGSGVAGRCVCEEGEADSVDTFVCPVAQLAAVGVDHESEVLTSLIRACKYVPLTLSTAYPNFPDHLRDSIEDSCCDSATILAPAEDANGFHGASGPKRLVPLSYSCLLYEWVVRLRKQVSVHLWSHPGHTFHVKGLWMPNLTVVGSSNLGHRSRYLDAELQFVVATAAPSLALDLTRELAGIKQHTTETPTSRLKEAWPLQDRVLLWLVRHLLYPFL
eukprot:Rhum_TRINITY_DN14264_c14_g1::Rhum_TRINITY_DN14264_c14_g1_i1::g.76546::m.76546/K00995/pgsA, PGS1; CDP-diacylglycerol--glycerol-3-phosphate 3-phosphatidyltransferase